MADTGLFNNVYNPDVLSCLANLSSDEVFTPPEIVNDMLDMLPQELFHNPDTKFLDPACKTGVFLREIAKRLIKGLGTQFPDLQERIDHIFHNQLYGISITELTSLLSRRSVYCSKYPNSEFSVSHFVDAEGNIRFKNTSHTWKDRRCIFCGISKKTVLGDENRGGTLEAHAYEWIHTLKPEEIFNMKFDVIIGNPPYQLSDGGAGASARPIYNLFVEKAKKLKPRFLVMIIPARWMTGGKGLEDFRQNMINDKRIRIMHDFLYSSDCFSGVEIKGGVCYFLWDRDYVGMCNIYFHEKDNIEYSKRYLVEPGDSIFIRKSKLIDIKNKVWGKQTTSFASIVSSRKPYGFGGDVFKDIKKYGLPPLFDNPIKDGYSILGLDGSKRTFRYVDAKYPIPKREMLNDYKLFVPRNWGIGELADIPSAIYLASPGEMCTETFIQIGSFKTAQERDNAYSYFKTKFFRTLVGIRKQDQGASRTVYQFVPIQDFSKPWTDEELYTKYNLSDEEIEFIESVIKPMDLDGGGNNGN